MGLFSKKQQEQSEVEGAVIHKRSCESCVNPPIELLEKEGQWIGYRSVWFQILIASGVSFTAPGM